MKNSTASSKASYKANSRAKVSLALVMALCVMGGGNSLLASESTAKANAQNLSDSITKAIDSNLTNSTANHNNNPNMADLSANHKADSKDLSVNRSNNSKDSTANHSNDSGDSIANLGNDSADLSQNHSNDSAQNTNKSIILAQNDSVNPSANATNPNSTNPSTNHKADSRDLSVNRNDSKDLSVNRNDSSDSIANLRNNSADLSQNHSNDSAQNTNRNIILAQNDSANQNATNPNPTDSSADSSNSSTDSTTDFTANRTIPNLTHAYDLGRIERTVKSQVDSNDSAVFITSKDIEDTNSNNIAEALRYQTGVFYHPASGSRGEPDINIRGFGYTQIGFFLDGIPMHSIYDKQTDWGQFSTYGISEMSISKGYTSPQYGMNTMGGAINMITSKPMDKLEVALKYGFISNNEHQAAVSLGSNLGQYYVQATYSFDTRNSYPLSHKFTPTTNQPNLEAINSYFTNHTLRFKVGFEPNENHEYSLNLIYQKGEKGGSVSASPTAQGNRYWRWPHYDKITAYLLGRSNITDMISLNTRLYYDSFYNKLRMYGNYSNGNIANGNTGASIYDDFTIGLIETLGFDFSDNINFKVGINLRNDNHKNYDPSKVADPETKLSDFSTSIFVEYAQRFNDMFRLMLSASYDRNDMLRAVISGTKDKKYRLQGGTAQAIVYGDWTENITSWLNVGYKTSLPTLKNRYSTTWGTRVPNPNLQPESAINAEFGTKFDYNTFLGTTSASVAVYYNDLTNMIVSVGATGCSNGNGTNNCTRLKNVRNGYSYGVEVGFSQGFWSDKITLGANYTYQQKSAYRSTDRNNALTGNKMNRILNYPEHIANAMLILTPFSQWDLIANLIYQSPQWSYNNGYSKNHSVFLVDLKTNLRIIDGLQFSLGVSNVFDALYYYSDGYYMPGRRIFLSLEYKY